MYESMTFEAIMKRCLGRVSTTVDKREGSILYDAMAPAAVELALMYIELAYLLDRAFPDTATGEDLTKKALERSLYRTSATKAVRKGYFERSNGNPCTVPLGTRFSGGGLSFAVTAEIMAGVYKLTAEAAGNAGNEYVGTLFPIDYVENLGAARLADILIPGEDEETDEALRGRYYSSLAGQAFGGNIADYKAKVSILPGVGGVKVLPHWLGGGTVKLIIQDSAMGVPSSDLIGYVQQEIDPVNTPGTGVGIAPIGHVVTVVGITAITIDVTFTLSFAPDYQYELVETAVIAAIQGYFKELAATWADSSALVVRVSQLETKILTIPGIIDITGTTLGGQPTNVILPLDAIARLGAVVHDA